MDLKTDKFFKFLSSFAIFTLVVMFTISPLAFAQTANLSTSTLSGKIIKIDGNNVTVDTNNETKQISIVGDTKITRDNADVKVSDLKVNDQINAMLDQNGAVLSVASTADKSSLAWILPLVVLGFILGVIAYLLLKKSQKGKIHTSVQHLNN